MKNIIELKKPTKIEVAEMLEVWLLSVKETHTFLAAKDIKYLKPVVESGLINLEKLFCIREDKIEAFMGINRKKLEMLFISPSFRKNGLGKLLVNHAIDLGIKFVDVNEQNNQAIGFYEHLGFHTFDKSEKDGFGNPFPILHMVLKVG